MVECAFAFSLPFSSHTHIIQSTDEISIVQKIEHVTALKQQTHSKLH